MSVWTNYSIRREKMPILGRRKLISGRLSTILDYEAVRVQPGDN
jgi:hypothetical protein